MKKSPQKTGELPMIQIVSDPADSLCTQPPVRSAVGELQSALKTHGVEVRLHSSLNEIAQQTLCILVAGKDSAPAQDVLRPDGLSIPDVAEATGLVTGRLDSHHVLLATGSDVRGLTYAVLELLDRVQHAADPLAELQKPYRIVEQPANPVRSIGRLFSSDIEDKSWYYDKSFWRRYLTMLATQRINRFAMTFGIGYNSPRRVRDSYFYFPYPFFLAVPGYKVRAAGLSDNERDHNLEMLRFIADETTRRGMHFQLGLWTHAYDFRDSPDVNYPIEGLTPETHAAYCRDALQKLLESCPNIDGITFRCHSESGIPQGSHDFWRTVFDGVVRAGRKRLIDIHSKGIDFNLINIALETGMPVHVSPKYSAEHMGLPYHQAAIQAGEWKRPEPGASLERIRLFTRYGYADYLREDRRYGVVFRIWPGTQRLLLWGDPALASGFGRYAHISGSLGLELWEPLSFKGSSGSGVAGTRDGYADASLHPSGGSWEKYLYTYRLWGRMLYNPDTPREVWHRHLAGDFGAASADCEIAVSSASRVLPLITNAHMPAASMHQYYPEIHTNIPIVEENRFAQVSPFDPALFAGCQEYADELISARRSGKYSPFQVSQWLENLSRDVRSAVAGAQKKVADPDDSAFRRLVIDTTIQAGIAEYFSAKLIAGVAYAFYQKTGDKDAIGDALRYYRQSRDAWAGVADLGGKAYVADITFHPREVLRGNWADRLAAIDRDLADMEAKSKETLPAPSVSASKWSEVAAHPGYGIGTSPSRPDCRHTPPASFRLGERVSLEISAKGVSSAALYYRHLDQSDEYRVVEMAAEGSRYRAEIPAEYTDSVYPLIYYFVLRDKEGDAWLYPGLNATLSNQPYFIIPQTRR